jgi:hypothetical protein
MPTTLVIDIKPHLAVERAWPWRGGRSRPHEQHNVERHPRQDTIWWQGSLMEIKARAEDTGGALGVREGHFFEEGYGPRSTCIAGKTKPCMSSRDRTASAHKVESERARALVIFTPGGLERMFEEGGGPAGESAEPPQHEYDVEAAAALAKRYGFEVLGPQLA